MKIAFSYDNGHLPAYFSNTEQFKVYEIEDNEIVHAEVIPAVSSDYGVIAGFCLERGIEAVVCGRISEDAKDMFRKANVMVFGNLDGNTDAICQALIVGILSKGGCGDDPLSGITLTGY